MKDILSVTEPGYGRISSSASMAALFVPLPTHRLCNGLTVNEDEPWLQGTVPLSQAHGWSRGARWVISAPGSTSMETTSLNFFNALTILGITNQSWKDPHDL